MKGSSEESYKQIFKEILAALEENGKPPSIVIDNVTQYDELSEWKEKEEAFLSKQGVIETHKILTLLRSIAVDFDYIQIKGIGPVLFKYFGDKLFKRPCEFVQHVLCGCDVHFHRIMMKNVGNDTDNHMYQQLR